MKTPRVLAALLALLLATPAIACDEERANRVLAQCTLCHSLEPGEPHLAGPNLSGIAGRKAASAAGFAYSKAFRALALEWNAAELDRFLADPLATVPGTAMAFAGLRNALDRAAVICRLTGAPARTAAETLRAIRCSSTDAAC